MRRLVALALLVAACTGDYDNGYAVDLFIDLGDSVQNADIGRIVSVEIDVAGDATPDLWSTGKIPIDKMQFQSREARFIYRPALTTDGMLAFTVLAYDTSGNVMLSGMTALPVVTHPGKTVTARVILDAPSTAMPDMMASPDLSTCSDGMKDGDETDVDCGGSCGPCAPGHACMTDADCGANHCVAGASGRVCSSVTCAACQISDGTSCMPAPAGTSCGASSCSGAVETDPRCDGMGACAMTTTSCGAFACGATSCKTTCAADTDCASGASCDTTSGTCKTRGLGGDGRVPTSGGPVRVALADLDGDGRLDAVTANTDDNVDVLLGQANGGFGAATKLALGAAGVDVAVADVNLDGKPDVVAATAANSVVVFLAPLAKSTWSTTLGAAPHGMAVGDLNRDGRPDMVVATSSGMAVLFGRGDGTFAGAEVSGFATGAVALADFDLDGKLDAFGIGGGTGAVALGDGAGGFGAPVPTGAAATAFPTVADLNHDGSPDVVAAAPGNAVTVLLGKRDGTFIAGSVGVGTVAGGLASADFDGDGRLDLVVADAGHDALLLLPGKGDGTFGAPVTSALPAGGQPGALATGDLDGDSFPDMVAVKMADNSLDVAYDRFPHPSTLALAAPVAYATGKTPTAIATADLFFGSQPEDGVLDLAVAWAGATSGVSYLHGIGGGAFNSSLQYDIPVPSTRGAAAVALADVDRDGHADVIVADAAGGALAVACRSGSTTVAAPDPIAVAVGDLDRNGLPDLVAVRGDMPELDLFYGMGGCKFAPAIAVGLQGNQGHAVALADMNGDGYLDAVVSSGLHYSASGVPMTGGGAAVFLGASPSGNFTGGGMTIFATSSLDVRGLALGDFDRDGKLDAAVAQTSDGTVSVFFGDGMGFFRKTGFAQVKVMGGPVALAAVDLDRDGKLDLVATTMGPEVVVARGNGDGTFAAPRTFPSGTDGVGLAVGDFDRDGAPDLALAAAGDNGASVLLNASK